MNSCWNWAVICKCYSRKNVEWRPLAVLSVEQITLGLFWGHPISNHQSFLSPAMSPFCPSVTIATADNISSCSTLPSCWKLDNRIKTGGVPPPCKSKKRPKCPKFRTCNRFQIQCDLRCWLDQFQFYSHCLADWAQWSTVLSVYFPQMCLLSV